MSKFSYLHTDHNREPSFLVIVMESDEVGTRLGDLDNVLDQSCHNARKKGKIAAFH